MFFLSLSERSHFSSGQLNHVGPTLSILMSQTQEFIFDYNLQRSLSETPTSGDNQIGWNFPGLRSKRKQRSEGVSPGRDAMRGLNEILLLQQRTVMQILDRLKLCTHRCQYTPQQPLGEMKKILNALNKAFDKLTELMLTKEMKVRK